MHVSFSRATYKMHVNDEWPREEIPHGNAYCSRHVGRVRKFLTSQSERRTGPTNSKRDGAETSESKASSRRWAKSEGCWILSPGGFDGCFETMHVNDEWAT